jgi:hypothetical protein
MKNILIKVFVAITYLAMIIINWLANALPINNITPGQVSDSYPNLFAPAGLTFSIWGLIYLLLGAYVLYQFGLFQKGKPKEKLLERIGVYFIIISIANMLWIFSWHYKIISLSLLLIITMLFFLIKIASLLNKQKFLLKEQVFIRLPFTIYFGWITVATIANATVFLVSINWDGFGLAEHLWTIIILIVGAIIGILRMLKDKTIVYGLVFIWAYTGIWLKHASPAGFDGQYPGIIITIIICIALFVVFIGLLLYKKYY